MSNDAAFGRTFKEASGRAFVSLLITQNITKMETDAQITSMRVICGCDLTGQQWVVRQLRGTRPYLCNAIWRPRLARVSPACLASELRRYSAWKGDASRLLFPGAYRPGVCAQQAPAQCDTTSSEPVCAHADSPVPFFCHPPPSHPSPFFAHMQLLTELISSYCSGC